MAYIEELAKALRHEDPEVRVNVANALKELKDPRATMPLIEALDDECEEVRRAVAWALHWCADERARNTFIEMLQDCNDSVRLWAAHGLQRVGDDTAVEALIKALKDTYASVREQAIVVLAKIGDTRAIGPLTEALEDEDHRVRSTALINLREAFGVEKSSDIEQAMRLMREYSQKQSQLNEQLLKALAVISEMEEASGMVKKAGYYRVLSAEYGIDEDRARYLLMQLMKKGLVYAPKLGYTQLCV